MYEKCIFKHQPNDYILKYVSALKTRVVGWGSKDLILKIRSWADFHCMLHNHSVLLGRDKRTEGPPPGGEPTGPGSGDVGSTHAQSTPCARRALRSPAAHATPATACVHTAHRTHLLPAHDRQHTHGESALRHVQKLTLPMRSSYHRKGEGDMDLWTSNHVY